MASGSTDMSTRECQITALMTWRAGSIMTVMTLCAKIIIINVKGHSVKLFTIKINSEQLISKYNL